MLELTVVNAGGRMIARHELIGEGTVRVGRAPDNDLVVGVASVSRWHAEAVCVEPEDDLWVIRDLGSRHGLWVDGVRVEEIELSAGTAVRIGSAELRVCDLGSRIGRELAAMLGDQPEVEPDLSVTNELTAVGSRSLRRAG